VATLVRREERNNMSGNKESKPEHCSVIYHYVKPFKLGEPVKDYRSSRLETFWLVLDSDGNSPCEVDNEEDGNLIVSALNAYEG